MKLTEEERHHINEFRRLKSEEEKEFIEGELVVVSDYKITESNNGIDLYEGYDSIHPFLKYKANNVYWKYCKRLPKIPIHFKFVEYKKPDDVNDNDLVVVKFRHKTTGKIFYDTAIAHKMSWMNAIGCQIIEDLEK